MQTKDLLFEKICEELKGNDEFITELVDRAEFDDYVDFIDTYQSTFDVSNKVIHFVDFIKSRVHGNRIDSSSTSQTDDEYECDQEKNEDSAKEETTRKDNPMSETFLSSNNNSQLSKNHETKEEPNNDNFLNSKQINEDSKPQKIKKEKEIPGKIKEYEDDSGKIKEYDDVLDKIKEDDSGKIKEIGENHNKIEVLEKEKSYNLLYPFGLFIVLPKNNQKLLEEARSKPEKQFEIGQFLIEGMNDFPENINAGFQYIEQSVNNNYIEAIIYYIRELIKGKIIHQDFTKANEYLSKIHRSDKEVILLLKGLISHKMNKFKKSIQYFEKGTKIGSKECIYQYAKMLFLGEGIKKNTKQAIKYFELSKNKGFKKSEYFITAFNNLSKDSKFSSFLPETQMIFITNNIKNLINKNTQQRHQNYEFSQLVLQPRNTEKLFFNKSLKSSDFLKFIGKYKSICIEINYSKSTSFNPIVELATKIQNKMKNQIKIGIIFTDFFFNDASSFLRE